MKYLTSIFILLLLASPLQSQEDSDFIIGQVLEIESEILGERREYSISLPSSYQGDDFYIKKSYPILVLLDGQRLFHLATGMIQTMSSGGIEQIPEMIVVGVSQINRNQELLPASSDNPKRETGSMLFRKFIEEELIPEVENNYRTIDCKILVGHSFGGLFVVESLLEASNFDGYLAIDPSLWWEDQQMNSRAKQFLSAPNLRSTSIYVSQSNNPFGKGLTSGRLGKSIQEFKRILDQSPGGSLRYEFKFYEKEDHFSIPLISLYEGLQYIFDGYKYPLDQIGDRDIQEIEDHYEKLVDRLGGELLPPGKLLNQVGLYLISNEALEKGLALLEINKTYYSNSNIPFNSLGEGYLLQEETELALSNFKRSLELNPMNANARRRIVELENE